MNSRKKQHNGGSGKILFFVLVACLALAGAFFAWRKHTETREEKTEESQMEALPASEQAEDTEAVEIETIEIETEITEAETEAEEKEEQDTQTAAETEAEEPACLENLSGLAPGTVLSPDQIDFDRLEDYFMSWQIEEGDNLYERINGKSYQKNEYFSLGELRYLKMPHYNFNGEIQVGEMIVNVAVEKDVQDVFMELFRQKYEIQSMYLIDNYWTGDPDTTDWASIEENNTSAFCFRQVTGGGNLSNHAYGKAIDLNPQQNPYVSFGSGKPKWAHDNASDYIDRTSPKEHMITHDDLAYQLFSDRGFRWGGDWNNPKDYQHFDKK